jgi:hypothetical protein
VLCADGKLWLIRGSGQRSERYDISPVPESVQRGG